MFISFNFLFFINTNEPNDNAPNNAKGALSAVGVFGLSSGSSLSLSSGTSLSPGVGVGVAGFSRVEVAGFSGFFSSIVKTFLPLPFQKLHCQLL